MFGGVYKGKKVLVTGHTGFKGSWLTSWLIKLGADVVGISKDVPTTPAMFEELKLDEEIEHYCEDIRNLQVISDIVASEKPDFLFHLAAQPIVSTSYSDPIETISSNVMGTVNLLEALRQSNHECTAVFITSDKAYDNIEQVWGYKENDRMGGKDVYSGSKGAAELVIKSYFHSFFSDPKCNVRLAVGRAGNVIGGGDWAKDRLVVDCVTSWSKGESVEIRSPNATRPWQHVLEPLSGYLSLGQELYQNNMLHGEGFNFGPKSEQNHTVVRLISDLSFYWEFKGTGEPYKITDDIPFHEAGLLKLNCDKALFYLRWQSNLEYMENIRFTGDWYRAFYKGKEDMYEKTLQQINEYETLALARGLEWME